jgi:metal-responsive CopG/Arc/MetJ family transcriptional regulator
MPDAKVQTTLEISPDLLDAVDTAVRDGEAASRDEFVTTALRHELAARRRVEIDAEFALMADDPEFQREALEIASEFATADWEALRTAERVS